MSRSDSPRVVILHNIISPHVTPVFQELAKHCHLHVLYCAESEDNRHWTEKPSGYSYQILANHAVKLQGQDLFTFFINPRIVSALSQAHPDVVIISGWDILSYQLAAVYCRLKGIPYVLHSGSTKFEPSWRRTISWPLVWLLVKGARRYLSYGTRATEYLVSLGASPDRITPALNASRPDYYHLPSGSEKKAALALRQEWHIASSIPIILYYGQLIERKGVDTLVMAVANIQKLGTQVALVIVGQGPAAGLLQQQANQLGLQNCLFVSDPGDEKMTQYYHASDIFVLPSREEVWGLVVNQAMMCGLPVIVSDRVGSGPDLVIEGETGLIFDHRSTDDLKAKLLSLLSDRSGRMKMGQAAAERVKLASPTQAAQAMYQVIHQLK